MVSSEIFDSSASSLKSCLGITGVQTVWNIISAHESEETLKSLYRFSENEPRKAQKARRHCPDRRQGKVAQWAIGNVSLRGAVFV